MQVLSGSSDGTVRLWSLGQQRCIETFHVHDEGVWALAVDQDFTTFFSGGRDKRVCATELNQGIQFCSSELRPLVGRFTRTSFI